MKYTILNTINSPVDLRSLAINELTKLADEIRHFLVEITSKNGGHLAPSLGVVEITIALHYVFHTPEDKIIWDVGHQSYPHKIITGRKERFSSIRQFQGLSGFPNINESIYDAFTVGHASTSLSLAVGEAVSRDLLEKKYDIIPVIGDGAMTGGLAFEALNMIGELKKNIIIILNDNEMSISPNVGAISKYLSRMIANPTYNRVRRLWYSFLHSIPGLGKKISGLSKSMEGRMKHLLIPGLIFEELGIRYLGPVDGHDLPTLISLFKELRGLQDRLPTLIHVITKKGLGYKHAEDNAVIFHGLGPFEKDSGKLIKKQAEKDTIAYSKLFGLKLSEMAALDKSIVAVTAAMREGTGLADFSEKYPDRFFDVGIAEGHAVTFASALALRGLKPYVAIYSSFLQRAYDQIIHDVANMNSPVRFIIDRAGNVGEDGSTHHGVFDISYLRPIPNLIMMSPRNGNEFIQMLELMNEYNAGPSVIRFPREIVSNKDWQSPLKKRIFLGKAELMHQGQDLLIIAYGFMVTVAIEVRKKLLKKGYHIGLINLRFIKPLDSVLIKDQVSQSRFFVVIEEGSLIGGVADAITSTVDPQVRGRELLRFGYQDCFIDHGDRHLLLEKMGLDAVSIAEKIEQQLRLQHPLSAKNWRKAAN